MCISRTQFFRVVREENCGFDWKLCHSLHQIEIANRQFVSIYCFHSSCPQHDGSSFPCTGYSVSCQSGPHKVSYCTHTVKSNLFTAETDFLHLNYWIMYCVPNQPCNCNSLSIEFDFRIVRSTGISQKNWKSSSLTSSYRRFKLLICPDRTRSASWSILFGYRQKRDSTDAKEQRFRCRCMCIRLSVLVLLLHMSISHRLYGGDGLFSLFYIHSRAFKLWIEPFSSAFTVIRRNGSFAVRLWNYCGIPMNKDCQTHNGPKTTTQHTNGIRPKRKQRKKHTITNGIQKIVHTKQCDKKKSDA